MKTKKILFTSVFLSCFIILGLNAQSDLERSLFNLPDVIFTPIKTPDNYEAAYKLMIKQPLDHKRPEAGYFYQKVYFSYKGQDRPTAIITNGYNKGGNNVTEVAELLDANQLNVEHRYFGESSPDSLDYTYLNFEQVTADLHHIRMLFDHILPGKWISTGISKGGTTTIFYKYFYPNDVDVSIPYVAPLNYEYEEKRIYEFLEKVGTQQCRTDMLELQKRLLEEGEDNLQDLNWFVKGKGLSFTYLTLGEAFEYAVLELPFSFWQYGQDCSKIPSEENTREERLQYLLDIVGVDFYSDGDMQAYASHYYQSANEMGYYGYETDAFRGLLKFLPYEPHPHAAFTPNKMEVEWEGTLTNKVADWIKVNGSQMIYINGAIDTWSATAVQPSEGVDALWYFLEGRHHADARIRSMSKEQKELMLRKIDEWLGN